mmetsp:Transcript_40270/g.38741  ORF Transcript_40270/g.38741 Transcript_40270/m.38741 type:complete len:82 (+) Transcript_40270:1334-1579(+)
MNQTRTFILTNEPRLKYYKNGTEYRGEVLLSRHVYAKRTSRDKFDIVTPNRTYYIREVTPGDSDKWIISINQAIHDFCPEQ